MVYRAQAINCIKSVIIAINSKNTIQTRYKNTRKVLALWFSVEIVHTVISIVKRAKQDAQHNHAFVDKSPNEFQTH